MVNNDRNGIDRTCLLQGNIGLNFNLANGVSKLNILPAMEPGNLFLKDLTSMPLLSEVSSGGVPFNVHGLSGSNQYCGDTPGGSGGHVLRVDIWPASDPACNSGGSGTLREIAAHEMSHVLGWNGGHGGSPDAANSFTVGCAAFIDIGTVPLSSAACRHDVEALFRAKASTSGWTLPATYAYSPILWTTDAPSSASVAVGATSQVDITQWLGTTGASVSRGNSSVSWFSGDTSRFTVTSSGELAGQSVGSAKLYLKAPASTAGYTIWTPFTVNGDSLTVQVSPPAYVVTSDQTPITSEGYHTFTSHVGDPGSSRVWSVDDSRTIYTVPDTTFSTPGNEAIIWVGAGSYTLRFGVLGSYQDIPGCTGGGDGYAAQLPQSKTSTGIQKKPTGPVPNAVEGCPPGGDQ